MAEDDTAAQFRKNARPPPPFTLGEDKCENWKRFKQRWNNFCLISNFSKIDRAIQVAQLENCLADDALKVLDGFHFNTPAEQRTTKEIIDAFDNYVIGQTNETLERYRFGTRKQEEGEPFNNFLADLRRLIKTCDYCENCQQSVLRDRIVLGINSNDTREDLLKQAKLSLKDCIDTCLASEAAYTHCASLKPEAVHKVTTKAAYSNGCQKERPQDPHTVQEQKRGRCRYCGNVHPFIKEQCPAWGHRCTKCNKWNHMENVCRSANADQSRQSQPAQRRRNVNQIDAEQSSEEEADWVYHINTKKSKDARCKMIIDEDEAVFQIDTGASCNMLPLKYAKNLQPFRGTLKMWNNTTTVPAGKCRRYVTNPKTKRKYNVEFIICKEDDCQPILGFAASQQMGLLTIQEENFERVASIRVNEFPEVFDRQLGKLAGKQTLRLKEDSQPVVMASRRVSVNQRPGLKKELDRLTKLGVIEHVSKPTPWLSQLVVATKKSGAIRICIDPHELNKALLREHYVIPVMEDVIHELRQAKIFSKADLSSGYWHVVLDEESSNLTTFQTPFGRYKWRRLPFGLSVSAEIFQKKLLEALEGLPGVICIADDVIIHGKNQEDHDSNMRAFLKRCREKDIKLNRDKLEIGQKSVTFMGHCVTREGLEADPEKIAAISNMPTPTSISELRRFMGMVNYLAKFLPNLSTVMQPLHNLLKNEVPWNWSTNESEAFEAVKELLCKTPVLAFYDPHKKLVIECDASSYGLGAVLMQENRPIAYASRSLTTAEKHYAQIEKEMLAAVYALEKFHHYTFAREVDVITDHKPLIAIWKKPLAKAPRRLQTLLLRARNYRFTLIYKPGTEIPTADTLSRAPASEPPSKEVIYGIVLHRIRDNRLEQIRLATAADEALNEVMKIIAEGWPEDKGLLPASAKPFHTYNDELTIQDGIIYRNDRVVIPKSMHKEMLVKVHSGHLGINSCLRRARDLIFWPGMSQQIREYVDTCGVCATYADKQGRESEVMTEIPGRPWQKLGCDLFSWGGNDYLTTYDYHSNFFEIDELQSTSSGAVIQKLRSHFARNGTPETVITDNGPQYASSTFAEFAKEWGFKHETISPGNSKANGAAEASVKIAKRLMRKCAASKEDCYKGLLNYRNTPTEGLNTSPAQRLLGRRTKTILPTAPAKLKPEYTNPQHEAALKEKKRYSALENDNGKDLRPLSPGENVRLQPLAAGEREWKEGTIARALTSRSYEVRTQNGRILRRNRIHIRAKPKATHSVPATRQRPVRMTPTANDDTAEQETNEQHQSPQRNAPIPPSVDEPQGGPRMGPTRSIKTQEVTSNNEQTENQTTTRSGRVVNRPCRSTIT